MRVELVQAASWRTAAYAARTCYNSHDKATKETDFQLLLNCIKKGHDSVLEHIHMTWVLEMTRSTSHQLVRHRMASISQQSQRYVQIDTQGDWFNLLDSLLDDTAAHHVLKNIGNFYKDKLEEGIKPEDARELLPNCTKTVMVFTCNMRSFRNIVKLRTSRHAQEPIRDLVNGMMAELPEELITLATAKDAKDELLSTIAETHWFTFSDTELLEFTEQISKKARKILE